MEIQRIYSEIDTDERLYSVLLTEEEVMLFSEIQKEFGLKELVRKTARNIAETPEVKRMVSTAKTKLNKLRVKTGPANKEHKQIIGTPLYDNSKLLSKGPDWVVRGKNKARAKYERGITSKKDSKNIAENYRKIEEQIKDINNMML